MLRAYLAGAMGGRPSADVLTERDEAVEACEAAGIIAVDPAATEDIGSYPIVDLQMSYEHMKAYVHKDEAAIRHCDAMIVLTGDTPSEGTGCEIQYAYSLGKPIIMVAPGRRRGDRMGFWNVKATVMVDTVWDAADYLAENYEGGAF